jgi:subtilisin family serine protease
MSIEAFLFSNPEGLPMNPRSASIALASILVFVACSERAESPTAPSAAATSSAEKTWVVAFKGNGLPADVDQMVADAGGRIVGRAPEIGGIAVSSANPDFGTAVKSKAGVLAADVATEVKLITPPNDGVGTASADNNGGNFSPAGPDPQPGTEPLYNQQWDKMRMNVSATGSYALQQGRRDVVVAILDTGTDPAHPDINGAGQLDVARSRSFVPSEPFIQDLNGHGTWCMSAVGAPINGVGISGVAPNVTLVALKVLSGEGSGTFFGVAQALIYSGLQHFDVASMSLGGYIPKNGDKAGGDHTDYILTHRAIQFARSNGVLPVAALGNENFNLSDGSFFRSFVEAPGEMTGVVGVSATGYYNQKAFYSNYGSPTDISAPGGSTRNYTGVPGSGAPPPPYLGIGRVLGAWSTTATSVPLDMTQQCTGPGGTPPCFMYVWIQGTSMATPNAAGVAALIISQYGDLSPTTVESYLQISANNQPCPPGKTVLTGPGNPGGPTATCQGGTGDNTFFGKGIVDAVKAVTLK